jgi:hypothetical protein
VPGGAPVTPGWSDEHWQLLAESAVVLLLVDLLMQCSLDASIVVTDASVLEVHLFILLLLGDGPMGVGAAVVSSHWVAHASQWETPTSPLMEIVAQMLK